MSTKHKLFTAAVLSIGLLSAAGAAQAALVSVPGGSAVNDTDLNIAWVANANLAATNTFGVSGISPDGFMNWNTAQSWIAAMNTAYYLGYNDWRLPTSDICTAFCDWGYLSWRLTCRGYNCTDSTGSEMGHLFYNELGGIAGYPIQTVHNANYSLFQHIQSNAYWSGTELPNSGQAWGFDFYGGVQGTFYGDDVLHALAVRTGQVATLPPLVFAPPPAAVPVPGAAWLLGSGLLGLVGVARRKAA